MARKKAKSSLDRSSSLKVDFGPQAIGFLGSLDVSDRKTIGRAIRLYQDEQEGIVESIKGKKPWKRLRAAEFRVVFCVENGTMRIPLIGDRKEVYKLVARLL